MLVKIEEKLKEIAAKFISTESRIDEVDKGCIRAISGRAGFPAKAVGAQTLAITFPEELPNAPFYVGLVWDDSNNALICRDTYMGEVALVGGTIKTTGFTAMTYRANASYSWYFRWVAFYYDK